MTVQDRLLTDSDIIRLGVEAGMRVNAMPEFPVQTDIDEVVDELGMRAVELVYRQQIVPEGEQ